jgi:nicotinate phosphoribosyltransferase
MNVASERRIRLDPAVFRLPVDKIRDGYYTDAYFNHAKALLLEEGRRPRALMQVFCRSEAMLGGIDEAIAVLKQCAGEATPDGWRDGWPELRVEALCEGDPVEARDTVLTIEGDYTLFAHLETVYLGCLARRTLVMRNVRDVVEAAAGKPILFFPARHDHWLVQTGDGWAAHVAGAIGVSTEAQASWWGGRGAGTIPHALIAAYGGDTVAAARAFARRFASEMNVVALVDFENDSVRTALEVADALGDDLWGVRLDTSDRLVDRSLEDLGAAAPRGVNPELVRRVRAALDGAGHAGVKIVVSGGFNAARIADFEREGVPVDAYGVGSSLLRGAAEFTADIVEVDGVPTAKVGRERRPNPASSRSARPRTALLADRADQLRLAHLRAAVDAEPRRLAPQLCDRHGAGAAAGALRRPALSRRGLRALPSEVPSGPPREVRDRPLLAGPRLGLLHVPARRLALLTRCQGSSSRFVASASCVSRLPRRAAAKPGRR